MDIRQIELFVAAAEEQNFTRATRREHIVQSGLSVAIRALGTSSERGSVSSDAKSVTGNSACGVRRHAASRMPSTMAVRCI